MEVIDKMLTVDPNKRLTANELLKNKILSIRGQDYSHRMSFNKEKQRFEKVSEETRVLDAKIEDKRLILKSLTSFNSNVHTQLN